MPRQKLIEAADEGEERFLRQLVELKDEIVNLMPGFPESAKRERQRLKPHRGEIYGKPRKGWTKEDRQAHRDNLHNVRVARRFCQRWALPGVNELNPEDDPSYLFGTPYSGCPTITGTMHAVTALAATPPVLFLAVDVRFDPTPLMRRIRPYLVRRHQQWVELGGEYFPPLKAQLHTLRNVVRVLKYDKVLRPTEVELKLKLKRRRVQDLRREGRALIEKQRHWSIAPYTAAGWADCRLESYRSLVRLGLLGEPVISRR